MIVRALWLGSDRSGTRSRLCNDEPGAGKCAPMREMLRCAPAPSPDIRGKAPLWVVGPRSGDANGGRAVGDRRIRARRAGGHGAGRGLPACRAGGALPDWRTAGLPGCRKRNSPRAYGSSPAGCVRVSRTAAGASSLRRRRGAVAERVSERRRHPGLSAVRRDAPGRARASDGSGCTWARVASGWARCGGMCRAGRGRATGQGVRGRGPRRAGRGAEGCAGPGAGERRVSVNVDEGRVE